MEFEIAELKKQLEIANNKIKQLTEDEEYNSILLEIKVQQNLKLQGQVDALKKKKAEVHKELKAANNKIEKLTDDNRYNTIYIDVINKRDAQLQEELKALKKVRPNHSDELFKYLSAYLKCQHIDQHENTIRIMHETEILYIECFEGGYVFNGYGYDTPAEMLAIIDRYLKLFPIKYQMELLYRLRSDVDYDVKQNCITMNGSFYRIDYLDDHKYHLTSYFTKVEFAADEDLHKVMDSLYVISNTQ